MTIDTSAARVTREVRSTGNLPGHQELAQDLVRRSFNPAAYPPELQAGLQEARTRGLGRNPRDAALFAIAFAEAARTIMDRERTALLTAAAEAGREAAVERRRLKAERHAAASREAARIAAESRARAIGKAMQAIHRAHFRVPADQQEEVARIMVERGLSASEAFDVYLEESPPSPRAGGRLGSIAR